MQKLILINSEKYTRIDILQKKTVPPHIIIREFLSTLVRVVRSAYLRHILGYKNIHPSAVIEGGVVLDKIYRDRIYIDSGCLVARGAVILSHEHVKRVVGNPALPWGADVRIGKNCFIGINAMICPGVTIGESCIVAGAAVVTRSIPSNSLVAGVPAKVKRGGVYLDAGAFLNSET